MVFVDDILSRGSRENTTALYTAIQSKYPMRSWDILSPENPLRHLGFEVTEEVREGQTYRYLSQHADVREAMERFEINVHSDMSCPMPNKWQLGKDTTLLTDELKSLYKSMLGVFSRWSISLRWDIAHSVSRLQSMVQDPTVSSLNEAYRVAAYVHSTASFKLGGKVVAGQKNRSECYSDKRSLNKLFVTLSCNYSEGSRPIHPPHPPAQLAERSTCNCVIAGSSPTVDPF